MLHPSVENAFEEIDAAIFSGDSFIKKSNRDKLREFMARWERGLKEMETVETDILHQEIDNLQEETNG